MGKLKQEKEEKIVTLPKNTAELQRLRLDRLMKNPDKPAHVPDPSKPYTPRGPLEFIRNVWGSSAGAGSGDFHVYRGVRRREYARQKFIKETSEKEGADETYHKKVVENAIAAEDRTAKKRAKRQKKKQKQKNKKPRKEEKQDSTVEDESEDDTGSQAADDSSGKDAGKNGNKSDVDKNSSDAADDIVRHGDGENSSDTDEKSR